MRGADYDHAGIGFGGVVNIELPASNVRPKGGLEIVTMASVILKE
ncbi:MAG: hypothetical protein RIB15_04505 [Gracilimonas sp.]